MCNNVRIILFRKHYRNAGAVFSLVLLCVFHPSRNPRICPDSAGLCGRSTAILIRSAGICPAGMLSRLHVSQFFAKFAQSLPDQGAGLLYSCYKVAIGCDSGSAYSSALDALLIIISETLFPGIMIRICFCSPSSARRILSRILICLHEITHSGCGFLDNLIPILCFIVLFSFLQGFFQQYVAGKRSEILRFCTKFLQKIYRNACFMF